VNGSCTDQVSSSANSSFSGINIDRTPPNAPGISAAPPANGAGWNNTNVTVSFLSNGDAGPVQSGVNNCTAPVVLNSETSAAAVSDVCTDFAGNVSATASTTIRIDKTAPSVSVQGVSNGATYLLGQAPTPHCSTTDALSGVATQASLTVTGGNSHGVGHFTATCSGATDRAGNITPPVSVSYNIGYVFNFTRLGPGNNVINSGDHADVRWQISDGSGNMIVRLDAVRSILVAPNSTCTAGGEGAPFNPTPKDNPALRFDGAAYRFRWDTAGIPVPACYSFMVGLDDESVHTVIFQLEKAH